MWLVVTVMRMIGEKKKKEKKKDGFLRLKAFAVSYGHMLI